MQVEIEFQHDWDDCREAGHFLKPPILTPKQRMLARLIQLAIFAPFILFGIIALQSGPEKRESPLATVAAVGICLLFVLGTLQAIRVQAMRAGWIAAGPKTMIEILDEGLHVTVRRRTHVVPWTQFALAREGESGLYLIDRTEHSLLLPRRAFASIEQYEQVVAHAQKEIAASAPQQGCGAVVVATVHGPASLANESPANALESPETRARHIERAKLGIALAILVPMIWFLVWGLSPKMQRAAWADWILLATGIFSALTGLWACVELALGKGFHPLHGVLAFIMPALGILYLATRADPVAGERINRRSLRGLLDTPMLGLGSVWGRWFDAR